MKSTEKNSSSIENPNSDKNDKKTQQDMSDILAGKTAASHREGFSVLMHTIVRRSVIIGAIACVVMLGIGWFVAGTPGLFSALLATAIVAFFCLLTPLSFSIFNKAHVSFTIFSSAIFVSWILKLVILLIVLLLLRHIDWFNHQLFGYFVVAGAVLMIGIETHAVVTSRIPMISPRDK